MRIFGTDGVLAKSRRFVSGAFNVSDEEVKSPQKLAELLRGILRRLAEAEALIPPEPMEFEVEVSNAGATVTLAHNMNSAVRYYVTSWTKTQTGSYPTNAFILVMDELSDENNLVLRSYVAGRAVVRVEPVFKGVSFNG